MSSGSWTSTLRVPAASSICRLICADRLFIAAAGRRCCGFLSARHGPTRSSPRKSARRSASRAVGQANHHNPVAIIVPCHRVIAANGTLAGFGGGLAAKEFLLKLEGARFRPSLPEQGGLFGELRRLASKQKLRRSRDGATKNFALLFRGHARRRIRVVGLAAVQLDAVHLDVVHQFAIPSVTLRQALRLQMLAVPLARPSSVTEASSTLTWIADPASLGSRARALAISLCKTPESRVSVIAQAGRGSSVFFGAGATSTASLFNPAGAAESAGFVSAGAVFGFAAI